MSKELIMTTIELKTSLHHLIDNITDESVLTKLYDLLMRAKSNKEGALWKKLSIKEQEELLAIENESRNSKNLLSHSEMLSKHQKWL